MQSPFWQTPLFRRGRSCCARNAVRGPHLSVPRDDVPPPLRSHRAPRRRDVEVSAAPRRSQRCRAPCLGDYCHVADLVALAGRHVSGDQLRATSAQTSAPSCMWEWWAAHEATASPKILKGRRLSRRHLRKELDRGCMALQQELVDRADPTGPFHRRTPRAHRITSNSYRNTYTY